MLQSRSRNGSGFFKKIAYLCRTTTPRAFRTNARRVPFGDSTWRWDGCAALQYFNRLDCRNYGRLLVRVQVEAQFFLCHYHIRHHLKKLLRYHFDREQCIEQL